MSTWEPRQAKYFAKCLRDQLGNAWNYMTDDVRRAMVAERALSIVTSQVRPVDPRAASELLVMMEKACGLDSDD